MSDPFSDLSAALAPFVGGSTVIAGFILGSVIVVVLIVILPWMIDPKGKDKSGNNLFISAILGSGIATGVGWYPIWFIFFVIVGLLWLYIDPMGSKPKAG